MERVTEIRTVRAKLLLAKYLSHTKQFRKLHWRKHSIDRQGKGPESALVKRPGNSVQEPNTPFIEGATQILALFEAILLQNGHANGRFFLQLLKQNSRQMRRYMPRVQHKSRGVPRRTLRHMQWI